LDAISAVVCGANRKTFSAENIFFDVGAKIASDVVEGPGSKLHVPKKLQTPSTRSLEPSIVRLDCNADIGCLKFGAWRFLGTWGLEFGTSLGVAL
jgi:hypothetical protein